jgi:hypothetical protein
MPCGQARFRYLFAEKFDAVLFPWSLAVETCEERIRLGFRQELRN